MNDSNDKYRNLLFLVRSHSFSLILLVAGIAWTTMYIRSVLASTDTADLSQPTEMLFAGLALILSAVLAMPAVLDRIPQKAYRVLMAAGVIGAAYFFMASTNSVLDEEQFLADQKAVNAITIQRLTDIRDAQLAYKEVNGEFTDSFDTLLAFINAPLVPLNFSIGSFHDTLPEAMCYEEGYVIRRADVPGVAAELGGTSNPCSTALPLMRWLTKCVTPCTLPSLPRILLRRRGPTKSCPSGIGFSDVQPDLG